VLHSSIVSDRGMFLFLRSSGSGDGLGEVGSFLHLTTVQSKSMRLRNRTPHTPPMKMGSESGRKTSADAVLT